MDKEQIIKFLMASDGICSSEYLLREAYEAGRKAGLEDAADYFEEHYHCSYCNPKEEFAAEIRKQKGDWHGNDPGREQQH